MSPTLLSRVRRAPAALGVVVASAMLLAGCTSAPDAPASAGKEQPASCPQPVTAPPADAVWFGASLDGDRDDVASYAERLGHAPAVVVGFSELPLRDLDVRNTDALVEQATSSGTGTLLLTVEPVGGLDDVTVPAVDDLVRALRRWNARGVGVVVRFAHEMNGSWYAWGQQPTAYRAAFRRVADAVHDGAPGSSTMWAPSYGGGYPFAGGRFQARAGSPAERQLDVDGNGRLDEGDDPYAPYWPGDGYVDWVGMSLYHWGEVYPWGENELPSAGKLVAQLRGTYRARGVDERSTPDFYRRYGEEHGKPVALAETAALYAPGRGGVPEAALKQAWWRQVFADDLHRDLPRLKMLNWFEWDKQEREVNGRVRWSVTTEPGVRAAFRADLPDWLAFGGGRPLCS